MRDTLHATTRPTNAIKSLERNLRILAMLRNLSANPKVSDKERTARARRLLERLVPLEA